MPLNIYHDHLSGFDSKYFSQDLNNATAGQIQVEYILPQNVKNLYPQLQIQFCAYLMVKQNHFDKFLNLAEPDVQEKTNFLCSFNRSKHVSRTNFVIRLFFNNWFNPEFCSKGFQITPDELWEVTKHLEISLVEVSWQDTFNFMQTEYHQGDSTVSNGAVLRDLADLSPLIQKSFITVVAETVADSYVPFPTEKICYPIANKTLWLAYAQPGYYKFIEKYMDIKPFVGIDYTFDDVGDPTARLDAFMTELKRIENLSNSEKADLYSLNTHVINHNFIILTTGEMIANLWAYDECAEHYEEIGHLTKIGGWVNRDIGSNLIKQLVLVNTVLQRKKNIS